MATEGLSERLARECLDLAAELDRVQEAIRNDLGPDELTSKLLTELQRLDGIGQTIADLARMFRRIEREDANGKGLPGYALDAITQTTLRIRLEGRHDQRRRPEIDLF